MAEDSFLPFSKFILRANRAIREYIVGFCQIAYPVRMRIRLGFCASSGSDDPYLVPYPAILYSYNNNDVTVWDAPPPPTCPPALENIVPPDIIH
jgi:hypothetical protein